MAEQPPSPAHPGLGTGGGGEEQITDYEKQRLSRIRSNMARMAALGLPTLSSSLSASSRGEGKPASSNKEKKKAIMEDDEYTPNQEEVGDASSSSSEDGEEDEQLARRRGKQGVRSSGKNSKTPLKKKLKLRNSYKEEALQQAIALSLEDNLKESDGGLSGNNSRHDKKRSNNQEYTGRKKTGKLVRTNCGLQLTEDEMVAYFFSFDEAGKGFITMRDLEKMAIVHNFVWTDSELAHMISCFDTDGDGKYCNQMQFFAEFLKDERVNWFLGCNPKAATAHVSGALSF